MFPTCTSTRPGGTGRRLGAVPHGATDRILYASDIPFGSPGAALALTGRLSIQAGLSREQIRGVMGGSSSVEPICRVAARATEPFDPSASVGSLTPARVERKPPSADRLNARTHVPLRVSPAGVAP